MLVALVASVLGTAVLTASSAGLGTTIRPTAARSLFGRATDPSIAPWKSISADGTQPVTRRTGAKRRSAKRLTGEQPEHSSPPQEGAVVPSGHGGDRDMRVHPVCP